MSLLDKIKSDIVESHVWKSIFRHGYEDTPRNRVMMVTANVFLHLHPAKVRRHAVRMRFTWCMGGLTFLMFLITVVTGIYLDVLLPAGGGICLCRHEVSGVRHALRHAHAQHASVGGPRDDRLCLAAHVPGLFNRVVQTAAGIQLDRRRVAAGAHAAAEFYRLSLAVGPTRYLGRDRRLQYGARDAAAWVTKGPSPTLSAPTRSTMPARFCSAAARSARTRCCDSTFCTVFSFRWSPVF